MSLEEELNNDHIPAIMRTGESFADKLLNYSLLSANLGAYYINPIVGSIFTSFNYFRNLLLEGGITFESDNGPLKEKDKFNEIYKNTFYMGLIALGGSLVISNYYNLPIGPSQLEYTGYVMALTQSILSVKDILIPGIINTTKNTFNIIKSPFKYFSKKD